MKKLALIAIGLSGIALMGCGQDLQKDRNGETHVNQINLERQFQRVITYDCNHAVKSDSIETVLSPTAWVRIHPDNPEGVERAEFVNRRNGAKPGMYFGLSDFQVDYSFGALNMHVESGTNVLDYKFFTCDQWTTDVQGQRTCSTSNTVKEQGTVTLNVNYTEKTLPGTLEKVDCPPPAPAPSPSPSATKK